MKKKVRRCLSMFLALLLAFSSAAWDTNLVSYAAEGMETVIVEADGQSEPAHSEGREPVSAQEQGPENQEVITETVTVENTYLGAYNPSENHFRGIVIQQTEFDNWIDTDSDIWSWYQEEVGGEQVGAINRDEVAKHNSDFSGLLEELVDNDYTSGNPTGYYAIVTEGGGYESNGMLNIPGTVNGHAVNGVILLANNWYDDQTDYFTDSLRTAGIDTQTRVLMSGEFGIANDPFVIRGSGSVSICRNNVAKTFSPAIVQGDPNTGSGTDVYLYWSEYDDSNGFCHIEFYGLDASSLKMHYADYGELPIGNGGLKFGETVLEDNRVFLLQKDSLPEFTSSELVNEAKNELWWEDGHAPRQLYSAPEKTDYVLDEDGKYKPVSPEGGWHLITPDAENPVYDENELPSEYVARTYIPNICFRFLDSGIQADFNSGDKAVKFGDSFETAWIWHNNIVISTPGNDCMVDINGRILKDAPFRGCAVSKENYEKWKKNEISTWDLEQEEHEPLAYAEGNDLETLMAELAAQDSSKSGYYVIMLNDSYSSSEIVKIPDTVAETDTKGVILLANNGYNDWDGNGDPDPAKWYSNFFRTGGIETNAELLLSGEFGNSASGSEFVLKGNADVTFVCRDTFQNAVHAPLKSEAGSKINVIFTEDLDLEGGMDATNFASVEFQEINHGGRSFRIGGALKLGDAKILADTCFTIGKDAGTPEFSGKNPEFGIVYEGEWINPNDLQSNDDCEWYQSYRYREDLGDGQWKEDCYVQMNDGYHLVTWDNTGRTVHSEILATLPAGAEPCRHEANLSFCYEDSGSGWKSFETGDSIVTFSDKDAAYQWYSHMSAFVPGGDGYSVDLNGKIAANPLLEAYVISGEDFEALKNNANVWDYADDEKALRASDFEQLLTLMDHAENTGYFLLMSAPYCTWDDNGTELTRENYKTDALLTIPEEVCSTAVKGIYLHAGKWSGNDRHMELPGVNVPEGTELVLTGDYLGTKAASSDFTIQGGGSVTISTGNTEKTILGSVKGAKDDGTKLFVIGNRYEMYGLDATGFAETTFDGGVELRIGDGGLTLGDTVLNGDTNIVMPSTSVKPALDGKLNGVGIITEGEEFNIPTGHYDDQGEEIYDWVWYPKYVVRKEVDGSWQETYYIQKTDGYHVITWDENLSGDQRVVDKTALSKLPAGAELCQHDAQLCIVYPAASEVTENNRSFANGDTVVNISDAENGYRWFRYLYLVERWDGVDYWYNWNNAQIDLSGKVVNLDGKELLVLERFEGQDPEADFNGCFMGEECESPRIHERFNDVETLLAFLAQELKDGNSGATGYYQISVRGDQDGMYGALVLSAMTELKGLVVDVGYDENLDRRYKFCGFESITLAEGQTLKLHNVNEGVYTKSGTLNINGKGTVIFTDSVIKRSVAAAEAAVRVWGNNRLCSLTAGELLLDESELFIEKSLTADSVSLVRSPSKMDSTDGCGHSLILYSTASAEIGNLDLRYKPDAAAGTANADNFVIELESDGNTLPELNLNGNLIDGKVRGEDDNGQEVLWDANVQIWVLDTAKLNTASDRYDEKLYLYQDIDVWQSGFLALDRLPAGELFEVGDANLTTKICVLVRNADDTNQLWLNFNPDDPDYVDGTKYFAYYDTDNGPQKLTDKFALTKQMKVEDLTIEAVVADQIYTGGEITPAVTVKDGDTVLTKGTHYTVSYSSNTNVGTATITVTMIVGSGYKGEISSEFKITAKDIADLKIADIAGQTYTGSAITPAVTVTYGEITLTPDTDYELSYSANTNVGTATVTITGKGNYTGTAAKTFKISAKNVSALTISDIADAVYTGSAITPAVTVKDGAKALTANTDYTAAYSGNINIGTAKVTITGKGNYTGTVEKTFKISAKNVSALTISDIAAVTYTGVAQTPAVTVKDGAKALTANTDYTVAYSANTNAGTATVTITGKGNYTGTIEKTFKINAKNVSALTISDIAAVTYTGAAQTPAVTVKDGAKALTADTDYTVAYSANTNAGTATVTITGKGNYTGTAAKTFAISAKSIEGMTVSDIADAAYTGSAITPAVTVADGQTALKEGTDYTVTYSDNTNAGTAKATITGKGNYTGSIVKTFAISPKNLSALTISEPGAEFYTGSAITPAVTVKDGEKALVQDTDYTVSYSDNTNPGTAKVTVSGKGNYAGTAELSFTILKSISGVKAQSASYNSIKVSWNKIDGVAGYKVYRAEKKTGTYKLVKTIAKASTVSFKNTKLTTGKKYYYKVVPYLAEKDGPESKVVSAAAVPAAAKITSVKNSAKKTATVTWGKVAGASGYEVYRATSKNGKYTKVKTLNGTTCKDTKLTKGKTYYYKVRAYRIVNKKKVYGSYSEVQSIKIKK